MIKIGKLCTGCAACLPVCPVSVLSIENAKAIVADGCIGCSLCIPACPINVISLMSDKSLAKIQSGAEIKKVAEADTKTKEKGEEVNGSNTTDSRV